MTAHKDMSGADLHEPKGIGEATSGQVYVADGSGSGDWTTLGNQRIVGEVVDYAGTSAPSGWLFAYGQAVSRTTYSALYAVLSTTYGVGDGSTTFNLPDLRGRVVAGKDNMGGTSANRLTDAYTGGLNGDTLGDTGGEEAHTILEAELAAHTHGAGTLAADSDGAHTHGYETRNLTNDQNVTTTGANATAADNVNSNETTVSGGAHTHTISGSTGSTGSGTAMNVVQPTIILNKIIYTGV